MFFQLVDQFNIQPVLCACVHVPSSAAYTCTCVYISAHMISYVSAQPILPKSQKSGSASPRL